MSNLIESILSEDYVSASNIFESRLNEIAEKKLIEMKKMLQTEITGGLTKADIAKRRKAGYVRASEVLPDPRDIDIKSFASRPSSSKKIVAKRKKKISEALSDTDIEKIGRERRLAQDPNVQQGKQTQDQDGNPVKDPKAPRKLADQPIKKIVGRQKDMDTRYSDAMAKARELQARGARGQVRMVMKRYAPYHVGKVIGSVAKGLGKAFADNSPI